MTLPRAAPSLAESGVSPKDRVVLTIAVFAALGAALAYVWHGWCVFPLAEWNEVRLAPAFALRHGYPLYPAADGGPLSTWIYGPIGVFLIFPVTWADSAAGAIVVGGLINVLTILLPLAGICFCASDSWRMRILFFSFSVLLLPAASLSYYVADRGAIAFGLLSCWLLAREQTTGTSSRLMLAALCCVMSISAKQTSVFLPLAQFAFLWREREKSTAVRYAGWLAGCGITVAIACCVRFGFENLWLNLVRIPGLIPWGSVIGKIALRYPQLIAYVGIPLLMILADKRLGLFRDSVGDNVRFMRCTTYAFLILLPAGLLSYLKIGGDTNVLHSWYYLLPAMVIAAVRMVGCERTGSRWIIAALGVMVALRSPELSRLPPRPITDHIQAGEQIARVHPATTWFPNNPVVNFYGSGNLYHAEDGISTRQLAGMGLREQQFRAHLPVPLHYFVYAAIVPSPFVMQLLPEFQKKEVVGSWAIYSR